MKNKILSSFFERGGNNRTLIANPSARVFCLMSNISSSFTDMGENAWVFSHKDIGTVQDMEKLFEALDNCA